MTTPNLQLPELAASQAQPHVTLNTALRLLDAMVNLSVIAISATPPGSPADGNRYIIDTGATGAWAGEDGNIAAYIGTSWSFITPLDGWRAFNRDDGQLYLFNATGSPSEGWAPFGGATTLNDLTDVDTTGASSGEVLAYDGSEWVPSSSSGGGQVTPDSPPASPNAADDEFDDASLDTGAKWLYGSAWSVGSIAYEGQGQGAYVMRLDPNGTAHNKAYAQAHSGSTYKYRAKVRLHTVDADSEALDDPGNYARVEIFVAQSSDNKRVSCVLERSGGAWTIGVRRTTGTTFNNATTYAAGQLVNGLPAFGLYLEIEDDGTNLNFRASPSGYDGTFALFRQESRTTHLSGTPDRAGFAAAGADATYTIAAVFEWFRRIS